MSAGVMWIVITAIICLTVFLTVFLSVTVYSAIKFGTKAKYSKLAYKYGNGKEKEEKDN